MSLTWKTIAFFAFLALCQARYSDYLVEPIEEAEDTPVNKTTKSLGIFHEHIIFGKVHCNGQPVEGVRPFLQSPWYNRAIEVITTTTEGGLYRLITTEIFNGHRSMLFTVRHQCPQLDIPKRENCAIPMYWTEIAFPLNPNKLSIAYNIDLGKMEHYTTAECLI